MGKKRCEVGEVRGGEGEIGKRENKRGGRREGERAELR
jgi:hypothetical protein